MVKFLGLYICMPCLFILVVGGSRAPWLETGDKNKCYPQLLGGSQGLGSGYLETSLGFKYPPQRRRIIFPTFSKQSERGLLSKRGTFLISCTLIRVQKPCV